MASFSIIGRNTQGVRLMVTEENETIVAVAKLAEKDESDESEESMVELIDEAEETDSDME